jgi:predicted DNA-binding transcriptional regulator AlpA
MDDSFFWRARSIQELSAFMGCTDRFIHSEIDRGHLKARKIGGKFVRLLPSDIREWLDSGISKPKEQKVASKSEEAEPCPK